MPEAVVLRVGTRGSQLARTQTAWVVGRLEALGARVETVPITTRGDEGSATVSPRIGGDGVFVRELEAALLEQRIDAAVHSLKDLPTADSPGLTLACVPVRAMPWDVFVGRAPGTLATLPAGAVIGTSSIRRVSQVRLHRPDLRVLPVRGNVDTRLRLLDEGRYDGLILAGAGLERLGLSHRIQAVLRPDAFWPAVAQGALVVQIRADDQRASRLLEPLDHPLTHRAVLAERSCLASLAGGCLAPIGAVASARRTGRMLVRACVLEEHAAGVSRITATALQEQEEDDAALGRRVAAMLVSQGADAMLQRVRVRSGTGPP
ncbi:MAG: hydroxymethylbilane synthase [Planctomycetia bacterium]|nr:hydroxymethylbilane synthase [Planctomycetia bacterium]